MTKDENRLLAEKVREEIKALRKKGFTYKVFYTAIEYTPMN